MNKEVKKKVEENYLRMKAESGVFERFLSLAGSDSMLFVRG